LKNIKAVLLMFFSSWEEYEQPILLLSAWHVADRPFTNCDSITDLPLKTLTSGQSWVRSWGSEFVRFSLAFSSEAISGHQGPLSLGSSTITKCSNAGRGKEDPIKPSVSRHWRDFHPNVRKFECVKRANFLSPSFLVCIIISTLGRSISNVKDSFPIRLNLTV
jgi:hypothetical protein